MASAICIDEIEQLNSMPRPLSTIDADGWKLLRRRKALRLVTSGAVATRAGVNALWPELSVAIAGSPSGPAVQLCEAAVRMKDPDLLWLSARLRPLGYWDQWGAAALRAAPDMEFVPEDEFIPEAGPGRRRIVLRGRRRWYSRYGYVERNAHSFDLHCDICYGAAGANAVSSLQHIADNSALIQDEGIAEVAAIHGSVDVVIWALGRIARTAHIPPPLLGAIAIQAGMGGATRVLGALLTQPYDFRCINCSNWTTCVYLAAGPGVAGWLLDHWPRGLCRSLDAKKSR